MAAVAGDPDVSHAAPAPGRLPGRLADARRPAHLRLSGPQLVTERAALRLVLKQRNEHLNDHARTSRDASMITAAGSEPGPGRLSPGAGIRPGCADGGGGGQGEHRMGMGNGGPDTRSGLAVSLAEQPVRLSGKFLSLAVMLWSAHRCSTCLIVLTLGVIPHRLRRPPSPTVACPPRRQGQEPGRRTEARARCGHGRKRGLGKAPEARQGPVQPDDRQRPYGPAQISSKSGPP